jgi:sugar (pentulose or hexulose) kinase
MHDLLLGIDAGTTNIKSVALTLDGEERYRSARENAVVRPEQGWAEQSLPATWERTCETIRDVVGSLGGDERIAAVGVTGQGDGCWAVNADGDPARDAILWSDGRAAPVVEAWTEDGTADRIAEICGSAVFPGAPSPILAWLKDNEPAAYDRIDTVLFCKDWLKYRLTGELVTDYTDASLPYLDVAAPEYSDETLELAGIPEIADARPRLAAGPDIVGRVTAEAADATRLGEGTPVVSGMLDVVASAVGSGVAAAGESSSIVGTTSLNQTFLGEPDTSPVGVGFTIALGFDSLWSRSMASMTGTPNLDWAVGRVAPTDDLDEIEAAVGDVPPGSEGVVYLPFLSGAGERAPFIDANARAGLVGLEPEHGWTTVLRAVYEGVALAMRDCYAAIPADPDEVVVSGGGARSPFWCQLFADCLGTELAVPEGEELGAKGAALLAGVGTDRYPDLETAVERTVSAGRTHEPRPDHEAFYAEWYDLYTDTYEAMFEPWAKRADLLSRLDPPE